jgi:hypothetical protein
MNSGVFKRILAAAIGLPALSGAAWAGGSDDLGCSKATLQGAYAFSVLSVASATGPGVVVGLGTFDGKGGFTQIDYPGDGQDGLSMTPPLTAFRTGQTGTYTVNPNCTGFQEINLGGGVGVVENAFVISNGGHSIDAVVAGFTRGGTAVPDQALVHFSKVASEQND